MNICPFVQPSLLPPSSCPVPSLLGGARWQAQISANPAYAGNLVHELNEQLRNIDSPVFQDLATVGRTRAQGGAPLNFATNSPRFVVAKFWLEPETATDDRAQQRLQAMVDKVSRTVEKSCARLGLLPGIGSKQTFVLLPSGLFTEYRTSHGISDRAPPVLRQPNGIMVCDADALLDHAGDLRPATSQTIDRAVLCNAAQTTRAIEKALPIKTEPGNALADPHQERERFAERLFNKLVPRAAPAPVEGSRAAKIAADFSRLLPKKTRHALTETDLKPISDTARRNALLQAATINTAAIYGTLIQDEIRQYLPEGYRLMDELRRIEFVQKFSDPGHRGMAFERANNTDWTRTTIQIRFEDWAADGYLSPVNELLFHEVAHVAADAYVQHCVVDGFEKLANKVIGSSERPGTLTAAQESLIKKIHFESLRLIELLPDYLMKRVLGVDRYRPEASEWKHPQYAKSLTKYREVHRLMSQASLGDDTVLRLMVARPWADTPGQKWQGTAKQQEVANAYGQEVVKALLAAGEAIPPKKNRS